MNLADFLTTGKTPATFGKAKALLVSARDQILSLAGRAPVPTGDRYPNAGILAFIQGQTWAITGEGMKALASYAISPNALSVSVEDFFTLRPEASLGKDGTGTVHVQGALVDGGPAILEKLGIATRYSTITSEIAELSEAGAKQINLVIDSPGGTVAGVREAAEFIAASKVPVHAVCVGHTCSAAYYLAAGAKIITARPSATVGNIGTILTWLDDTAFWQAMGIEWKALTNEGADLKSTFHLEPNKGQTAFLQESLNDAGKMFQDHVTKHRPGINKEVFRAGWYSGEKAVTLGLVDKLSNTFSASTPAKVSPASSTTTKPTTSMSEAPLRRYTGGSLAAPALAPALAPAAKVTAPAAVKHKPTKFTGKPDAEVIEAMRHVFASKEDKEAGAAEMAARGYHVEGNRVFMERSVWSALPDRKKNAAMAAGFGLRDTARPETPSEFSESCQLSFPTGPTRKYRTVAQFMAMSAAEVAKGNTEAQNEETGAETRQEVLDAAESLVSGNWRYYEVPPEARTVVDYRTKFFEKFRPSFQAMRLYGPYECTPNDPAPPVPANPMTAGDFIGMHPNAAAVLNQQMTRLQKDQRNQRAELKRAYAAGSPAEKMALHAIYKSALTAFPKEFI